MCISSQVGEQYRDGWWKRYPYDTQPSIPPFPYQPGPAPNPVLPQVSREEFEALQKELENVKKLLKLAKAVDRATGQPDCEMDDKVAFLRKMAELLEVDLSEVL